MKRYTLKTGDKFDAISTIIDYAGELNASQLETVQHRDGPLLVIAGAGSGKTRTLVYRVAYLVEHGIHPQSILLLTFTRKASQEMMRRSTAILDERCMQVAGGTFHSFASMVLRRYGERLGYSRNYSIIDRGDGEDIIKLVLAETGDRGTKRRFPRAKTILDIISKSVNTERSFGKVILEDYPQFMEVEETLWRVARRYDEYKREKSIMDYDDLLINLKQLLSSHEDICRHLSETYRYIMIDEYQDTNKMQAEIAYLLAGEHRNLMVVGDDSQSIYAFRGARFKNIMDFPRVYPECRVITLEQNYRSTMPILSLTNSIIDRAREKYSKRLFSTVTGEQKPVYIQARDENEQALFVCQRVLELREEGIALDDMAVLFRSGWHSNELEIELNNSGIPYVKYGGLKFAEAAHVKDVMSLARAIFNPLDAVAWYRFLMLHEGLGPKGAQSVVREIVDGKKRFDGLVSDVSKGKKYAPALMDLHDVITTITGTHVDPAREMRLILDYYTPLMERKYDDFHRRENDLESLVRIAERYAAMEPFLTDMTIEPPEHSQVGVYRQDGDDEKLVLSTIHSAKGLEWNSVFLIGLVDGYLPSSYSLFKDEDIEEERRLFYVAATRAEKNLYLVKPEVEFTGRSYFALSSSAFCQPSRFITEIQNFEELTEEWRLDIDRF